MKWEATIGIFIICFTAMGSFNIPPSGDFPLAPDLSGYRIYEGRLSDLNPGNGFVKYQLATPLFTDYAEKERLIKIPRGASFTITGDGLPVFPDGTILVKTFFYWIDKRDNAKGRQVIETRLLVKTKDGW